MSFARAFDEIFKTILRGNWNKPHIKKVDRSWVCSTRDGRCGFGVNPQMAYGSWETMSDKPRRRTET